MAIPDTAPPYQSTVKRTLASGKYSFDSGSMRQGRFRDTYMWRVQDSCQSLCRLCWTRHISLRMLHPAAEQRGRPLCGSLDARRAWTKGGQRAGHICREGAFMRAHVPFRRLVRKLTATALRAEVKAPKKGVTAPEVKGLYLLPQHPPSPYPRCLATIPYVRRFRRHCCPLHHVLDRLRRA